MLSGSVDGRVCPLFMGCSSLCDEDTDVSVCWESCSIKDCCVAMRVCNCRECYKYEAKKYEHWDIHREITYDPLIGNAGGFMVMEYRQKIYKL
jgi:hypothetical protein